MYARDDRCITVQLVPGHPNSRRQASMNPDDFRVYELTDQDFLVMSKSGFLSAINERYGLFLGDFEAEEISDDLDFVLREAAKIRVECPTLYQAALDAASHGVGIGFEL